MPAYLYTAVHASSGVRRGTIEERDLAGAIAALKARGLVPTDVREHRIRSGAGLVRMMPRRAPAVSADVRPRFRSLLRRGTPGSVRIQPRVLAPMTRQLATLVAAGLPLLRSLETLERQQRHAGLRLVLARLGDTVRSGESLSSGLARFPRVFDRLYVNMVRAGEASGMLDGVLERLAHFLEKREKLRSRVKAAMAYPLIVAVVATTIVGALTVFVVPRFEEIFLSQLQGRPLPALTQGVLAVSKFAARHAWSMAGVLLILAAGVTWARRRRGFQRVLDRWLLTWPMIGPFAVRADMARLARTLGALLSAGVPILQAIRLTREATLNSRLADLLTRLHDRVEAGDSVAALLAVEPVIPEVMPAMIEVGESTGKLPEMLIRTAEMFDEEVDTAVTRMTSLLEPVMIVVMAVVVGTIVIALFLPMVEIIKGLSGG